LKISQFYNGWGSDVVCFGKGIFAKVVFPKVVVAPAVLQSRAAGAHALPQRVQQLIFLGVTPTAQVGEAQALQGCARAQCVVQRLHVGGAEIKALQEDFLEQRRRQHHRRQHGAVP